MRRVARTFSSLVIAVLLVDLSFGGVVPLWAQQQPFQWQQGLPGGAIPDGQGGVPAFPAGPAQPPSTWGPQGGDWRFRRAEEAPRPMVRQCAATANWPRAPIPQQPWPGAPPAQVVGAPQPPVQAPQPSPRQGTTQGVGSITVKDLAAQTPPQQLLTPGMDPSRPVTLQVRESPGQPAQGQGQTPPSSLTQPQGQVATLGQAQPQGQAPAPQQGQAQGQPAAPPAAVPDVWSLLMQEPISPIEQTFGDLRQFGYAVFSSPVSTFAPVDDVPVGPDYVLGPGDDLIINVSGAMDSALVRTVDRNGRVFLPRVGPVRVWGLTFSQADRLVREELARYFRGFYTTVTLGRLRTIRVHVVGEVCQPGSYTVSSLSTLTNALYAAGGPTKLGSLREIRLLRNSHQVGTLDLYDFLLKGDRSRDFRLESGDTIFVPTIGPVVAVEGEVKRPAIYEVRGPVRVSDLILTAGGVTPRSYLKRVQVIRQEPSAERTAIDLDLTNVFLRGDRSGDIALQNGDLVRVFPSDYRVYNVVHVAGAVKYPGDYELKPEMRISQLLPQEKLLPEAYLDRVEIVRRRPDLSTEVVAVDLKQAWAGQAGQDVALKPLDEVHVRSELRRVGVVTLRGEVKRPGQYSISRGERLSSVIRRAGGFTDRAFLKGAVFTRASLQAIEQEQLNTFVKNQERTLLAQAAGVVVGVEKDEAIQMQQAFQAQRDLLKTLATRVAVGRMVVRLAEPEKLENTRDDVVLEDGDSLRVPEPPSSVLVIGSVRQSTSVQFTEGMGVEYYIGRVGGFSKEADKDEVHIVRADGSAVSGFPNIRTVEPGDAILVPPKIEEKTRFLPAFSDLATVIGQGLISFAALAVLF